PITTHLIPLDLYALAILEIACPASPVRTFLPFPASPVNALVAPMNMLSLNLSRCPRKLNQGPAGEPWPELVLTLASMRTGISRKSLPSQAGQGSNNCNLWV